MEWQFKLQSRVQKPGEQLVEFAGALRVLANKAYLKWPAEQVKELLRIQFVHGICSSSIQFELMKNLPGTMDEALQKATQQELVEAAQRQLHKEKAEAFFSSGSAGGCSGAYRVQHDDGQQIN